MRLTIVALILGIAGSACTASVGAELLLDDPDLVAKLDLAVPRDIAWQRTVAGVEVYGVTGTQPDLGELGQIERALDELPDGLVTWAGLDAIYRVDRDERLESGTLAFTRGTNIYLIDDTFTAPNRLGLTEVMAHELAHVAQFTFLDNGDLADLPETEGLVDPIAGARLTRDFAAAVGWNDHNENEGQPNWILGDGAGTTEYGRSAPAEDMAESFARFVIGRFETLSPARVQWISEWTGLTPATAANGKPWVPAGAVPLTANEPLYDATAVAQLAPRSIEVESFLLDGIGTATSDLVTMIQSNLLGRGFAGVLQPVDDDRLPRFGGVFTRADGRRMWVELWDFGASSAFSSAPPGPVLTYVTVF